MIQAEKAQFQFERLRFTKIEFNEENGVGDELDIDFDPKGIYFQREGRFQLTIKTITYVDGRRESPIWELTMIASFKFDTPPEFDKISPEFFGNVLSLSFPFIRSFFSSVSLQAGAKIVLLPLLNVHGEKEKLIAATVVQ